MINFDKINLTNKLKKLKNEFKQNRKKLNACSYPIEDNLNRREQNRELKKERKKIKELLTRLNNEIYFFFDVEDFSYGVVLVKKMTKEKYGNKNFYIFSDCKKRDEFAFKISTEKIAELLKELEKSFECFTLFNDCVSKREESDIFINVLRGIGYEICAYINFSGGARFDMMKSFKGNYSEFIKLFNNDLIRSFKSYLYYLNSIK